MLPGALQMFHMAREYPVLYGTRRSLQAGRVPVRDNDFYKWRTGLLSATAQGPTGCFSETAEIVCYEPNLVSCFWSSCGPSRSGSNERSITRGSRIHHQCARS